MGMLSELKMRVWEILEQHEPGKWMLGTVTREFERAMSDELTAEAIAEIMLRRVAERQIHATVQKIMEDA